MSPQIRFRPLGLCPLLYTPCLCARALLHVSARLQPPTFFLEEHGLLDDDAALEAALMAEMERADGVRVALEPAPAAKRARTSRRGRRRQARNAGGRVHAKRRRLFRRRRW